MYLSPLLAQYTPMALWSLSVFCLLLGFHLLLREVKLVDWIYKIRQEALGLKQVVILFQELQETLEAGCVPEPQRWEKLKELRPPWGGLAYDSVQTLRSQGSALVPTLRRLRQLAEEHQNSLKEARAKSSQALAQALICGALVPILGIALYFLLPGISEHPRIWMASCMIALLVSGYGALWLLRMAEQARWGGLKQNQQSWALSAQCAGERLLALIRAGSPADMAWAQACEFLSIESPGLAAHWGFSIWASDGPQTRGKEDASGVLCSAGTELRKAIHLSLMEGRPCTERIETLLYALRKDFDAQVERELNLLSTRALKPLFLCVAPSLFGLLLVGLALGWERAISGVL